MSDCVCVYEGLKATKNLYQTGEHNANGDVDLIKVLGKGLLGWN